MNDRPKYTIRDEISKTWREQGAELQEKDVGRALGEAFGRVLKGDVGKRVWLKPYGLVMENDSQRDARKTPVR